MENEIVRWVLSYIAFRIHKFVNLQYPCTIMVNYSITDTFGGLLTGNICRKNLFLQEPQNYKNDTYFCRVQFLSITLCKIRSWHHDIRSLKLSLFVFFCK